MSQSLSQTQIDNLVFKAQQLSDLTHFESSHICVTNSAGVILWVNEHWMAYGSQNGAKSDFIGSNYFRVIEKSACANNEVAAFVQRGLFWLLEKPEQDSFAVEYPCHSDLERSWYEAKFVKVISGASVFLVVIHSMVTKTRHPNVDKIVTEPRKIAVVEDNLNSIAELCVGQTISGKKIAQKKITSREFVCAEFSDCEFVDCDFTSVVFLSCEFINCKFENCKFQGVDMKNCTFEHVNFGVKNLYQVIHFENCRSFLTKCFDRCDASFFGRGMIAVFA